MNFNLNYHVQMLAVKIDRVRDLQELLDKNFDIMDLEEHCDCGNTLSLVNEFITTPKILAVEISRDTVEDGSVVVNQLSLDVPAQLIIHDLQGRSVEYEKPCIIEHHFQERHYTAIVPTSGIYSMTDDSV